MPDSFSGRCACGKIRYECSGAPVLSVNCYCRDCQRASGSAYAADIVVNAADWKLVSGKPNYFEQKADSGNIVSRGFCGDCGSPLFVKEVSMPDIVTINVGSLDDPGWYQPTVEWWTRSAQPWVHMNPDTEKLETQPD